MKNREVRMEFEKYLETIGKEFIIFETKYFTDSHPGIISPNIGRFGLVGLIVNALIGRDPEVYESEGWTEVPAISIDKQ